MIYIAQSLTAIDHRACRLRWGASSADDLAGYNVYMSFTNTVDSYQKINDTLLTEPEYVYGVNLRNDHEYYFYVTAVDTLDNESERGNIIQFRLSDYREEEVIVVDMPKTIVIESQSEYADQPPTRSFVTKFEVGGAAHEDSISD